MAKPDNLGVIVFLGVLVGCLCTLTFWLVLKFYTQDGQFKRQQRESEKAALVLRDEREKLERLLKAVEKTEKEKE
jgi:uncharacterized membrane protein